MPPSQTQQHKCVCVAAVVVLEYTHARFVVSDNDASGTGIYVQNLKIVDAPTARVQRGAVLRNGPNGGCEAERNEQESGMVIILPFLD